MMRREIDASNGDLGRHASRTRRRTIDANPIIFCDDKSRRRISPRGRLVGGMLALLAIAPLLGGCGSGRSYYSAAADARAQRRHDQDCANPKWKAANPGLYDNLCPRDPFPP